MDQRQETTQDLSQSFASWLRVLSEASSALASSREETHLLTAFTRAVTKEFCAFVIVDTFDDDGGLHRQLVVHDERTARVQLDEHFPVSASRGAAATALPAAAGSPACTVLSAPLTGHEKELGFLALGGPRQDTSELQRELVLELGRRVSCALDNARYFLQVTQDRHRLDTALDAGKVGAWDWDINKQRVTWSPALEEIHGLPRGSFPGTYEAYQADIHPDDRERVLAKVSQTVEAGGAQHNLYRIIRPDGQVRWLETHGTLIYDRQGRPSRLTGVCSDVTERKEARDRLEESERRFRAVFDGALDAMVIVDDDRRFVDANPAAGHLLQRSVESILGTSVVDLYESEEIASDYWLKHAGSQSARGEARLRRSDNTFADVEFSARRNVVPGRHLGVWRDVASRKRAECLISFLAEASVILARTLDYREAIVHVAELAVPLLADWVAIDLVEPDGTFRTLAVTHADKSKVDAILEVRQQCPPSLDDEFGAGFVVRTGRTEVRHELPRDLLERRVANLELVARLQALSPRALMCVPLSPRGKVVGAITFVSANSGRSFSPSDVQLAEDLALRMGLAIDNAMLLESEQSARKNADFANRAKDDFLAMVSHELRTPLNAMLGWTRMLQTGELTTEKRDHALETIERNAMVQAQLIEDLLDVTRIISGKLRLDLQEVDLAPLVNQVRDTLRPASEKKKHSVEVDVEQGLAPIVADANRIQQVLWNLLSNSIKFTPTGGRIRLSVERADRGVKVHVVDTGAGIKAEFMPLVFERFQQADGATTRAHRGLGLGLAISSHIVEMHGGTIEVESEGEGKGSRFTVFLPLKRDTEAPSEAPSSPNELAVQLRPELRNLRVLVVDDEQDGRDLLTAVLERAGAVVFAAESAAEAFSLVRSQKPDVLISDIGMAGADGYELIRNVRALPPEEGGNTPAAALTAYARAQDRRKALDAGYMMHLAKPVEPAELIAVIANLTRFRESKD